MPRASRLPPCDVSALPEVRTLAWSEFLRPMHVAWWLGLFRAEYAIKVY